MTREAEDGEVDDAAGSFVRSQVSDVDGVRSGPRSGIHSLLALLLLLYVWSIRRTQDAARSTYPG